MKVEHLKFGKINGRWEWSFSLGDVEVQGSQLTLVGARHKMRVILRFLRNDIYGA